MKKEIYDSAEIEVIRFSASDVIAATGEKDEDDELPFVPKTNN